MFISLILISFILSVGLFYFGRIAAVNFGFVDQPGGRKKHDNPVPPIGGLIIVPVFFVFLYLKNHGLHDFIPLFTGSIILLVTGALDDKLQVNAFVKFIIQIIAASLVVLWGGVSIQNLGDLLGLGNVYLWYLGPVFSILCLVLFMNALNMMDGLDGLAGGFLISAIFWLMLVAYMSGYYAEFQNLALLAIPLIAFLVFNMRSPLRNKASVFLGDAGSLALGLIIGYFVIKLSQAPFEAIYPMSVAWIIALPVMDLFALFFVRLKQGRYPFSPDRNHLHHRIVDKGYSVGTATVILISMSIIFGAIGYSGYILKLPEAYLLCGWVLLLAVHTYFALNSSKTKRVLSKSQK